jgi:hypothetical protein
MYMYTTYKDTVGPVVGSVALRLTLDIMCYNNVQYMMLCCIAYRYGFPIYIVPRDLHLIVLHQTGRNNPLGVNRNFDNFHHSAPLCHNRHP